MSDPAECEILGRWRIVAADQWDREYLDLVEPAFIRFDRDGLHTPARSCSSPSRELTKAMRSAAPGRPNLLRTALEIELSFHNGDDAVLKAKRE
jgi:hypothetical protein